MPQTIYTASHSEAKVNEETIDGLQSIDYRVVRNRHDLVHGDAERDVTLQQCFMEDKSFALDTEHHGETVYTFTARSVEES